MSFITNNYIWFLVFGFVMLMITIGYYADKTKFGKKKLNDVDESESLDTNELYNNTLPNGMSTTNQVSNIRLSPGEAAKNVAVPEVVETEKDIVVIDDYNNQIVDIQSQSVPEIKALVSEVQSVESDNKQGSDMNYIPNNVNLSDDDIWKF